MVLKGAKRTFDSDPGPLGTAHTRRDATRRISSRFLFGKTGQDSQVLSDSQVFWVICFCLMRKRVSADVIKLNLFKIVQALPEHFLLNVLIHVESSTDVPKRPTRNQKKFCMLYLTK